MKRNPFLILLISLILLALPACQEDEWVDWKLKNEQWLESNKNKPGIKTTESGLQYEVIYQGWKDDRKPNKNSTVKVNYKGYLIDEEQFEAGSGVEFNLAGVIKGWQEGISRMNGGGIYKLYIPSKLAYDTVSNNPIIPPHSTLIYEVDLISSY